jgi:hypothetical protein
MPRFVSRHRIIICLLFLVSLLPPALTTPYTTRRSAMARVIQRRNMLAAAAGLWGLTRVGRAWAQDATPQTSEVARADHPINGAWEWSTDLNGFDDLNLTNNIEQGESHPTPIIFSRDGTCLEYDAVFGVGIGFWRTLDAQQGEVVMQYQTLAGPWLNITGPVEFFDVDHVPTPPTFDYTEFIVTRSRLTVDDAGDQLTSTTAIQQWTGRSRLILEFEGSTSRTGKRLST